MIHCISCSANAPSKPLVQFFGSIILIPLNLDGCLLTGKWQSGMRTQVLNRLAADFTGWEKDNAKFEQQFERIVKALRADGGARQQSPKPRL